MMVKDDAHAHLQSASAGAWIERSPMEDLPPECLRRVLEYTFPRGLTSTSKQFKYNTSLWTVQAALGNHKPVPIANGQLVLNKTGYLDFQPAELDSCQVCSGACEHTDVREDMHTALLYINKAIASEARGTSCEPIWRH